MTELTFLNKQLKFKHLAILMYLYLKNSCTMNMLHCKCKILGRLLASNDLFPPPPSFLIDYSRLLLGQFCLYLGYICHYRTFWDSLCWLYFFRSGHWSAIFQDSCQISCSCVNSETVIAIKLIFGTMFLFRQAYVPATSKQQSIVCLDPQYFNLSEIIHPC